MTTVKTNISKSHGLLGYLAAIGLAQELHTIDATATTHWEGSLVVTSALTEEEIHNHLAHHYAPAGIIAPWQTANGVWRKDRGARQALDIIINSTDKRASKLQVAYSIAEDVIRNHLCNIGDERPGRDTQDAIQEELANNYPDHDIGKYAALLLAPTRPLPGNKGTNGRYTYSGEHIRAAARLITSEDVDWAANIIRPNSNLPMSKINYSGLCPQEGRAISHVSSEIKQGNPLLLMLAMQGLIATRYAIQYSSYTHMITPMWCEPMTYSRLCNKWLDAAIPTVPAHQALRANTANITMRITGINNCVAYAYTKGYIGRDQIHARRLGYVSIEAPDKCSTITIAYDGSTYYRIARVGKPPVPPHRDRPNYGRILADHQFAPAGIEGAPLAQGTHQLPDRQIILRQTGTMIQCYIVQRDGLHLVRDWAVNKSDESNPMRSHLTGRQLRDIAARYNVAIPTAHCI